MLLLCTRAAPRPPRPLTSRSSHWPPPAPPPRFLLLLRPCYRAAPLSSKPFSPSSILQPTQPIILPTPIYFPTPPLLLFPRSSSLPALPAAPLPSRCYLMNSLPLWVHPPPLPPPYPSPFPLHVPLLSSFTLLPFPPPPSPPSPSAHAHLRRSSRPPPHPCAPVNPCPSPQPAASSHSPRGHPSSTSSPGSRLHSPSLLSRKRPAPLTGILSDCCPAAPPSQPPLPCAVCRLAALPCTSLPLPRMIHALAAASLLVVRIP